MTLEKFPIFYSHVIYKNAIKAFVKQPRRPMIDANGILGGWTGGAGVRG